MNPPRRQRLTEAGQRVGGVSPPNVVERRMSKFLSQPPSIRTAASVIVTVTAIVVVGRPPRSGARPHRVKNVWSGCGGRSRR